MLIQCIEIEKLKEYLIRKRMSVRFAEFVACCEIPELLGGLRDAVEKPLEPRKCFAP